MLSRFFFVSTLVLSIFVGACGDHPTGPSGASVTITPQTAKMGFGETLILTADGGNSQFVFSLSGDRYNSLRMTQIAPNQLMLQMIHQDRNVVYTVYVRAHSGNQYDEAEIVVGN